MITESEIRDVVNRISFYNAEGNYKAAQILTELFKQKKIIYD